MILRAAITLGVSVALVAVALARGPQWGILSATLAEKTDRYGHNVLGGNEYATLVVSGAFANDVLETRVIELPVDRVFEDIEARIAPLTGDVDPNGNPATQIVVVESSTRGGAELAIYGFDFVQDPQPTELTKLAATPPIGRRNRWLAPAGIADFNGDGQNDIAYVETPHLGGTLRVWTFVGDSLEQIASKRGFSNHRIGEDFITGGVRDCGDGPELVLPDFHWSELMAVRIEEGILVQRSIANRTDRDTVSAAMECRWN